MSDIAIRVENLSKSYQITHSGRGKYKTLQEDVIGFLKQPFSRGAEGPTRETFWALKDVSFEVKHGEVLGIIGRNGAGKSTLLKILSRITKPTSGYAEIYGRVGSLLEVGTGFHPELTGRENIFLNGAVLGMSRRDIMKHFDEIVAFADVEQFLDTPAKRYSSGMYMRLAFAVAAHLEPEVLVVDEVLAVGDAEFQKKCLGKMSEVAKSGRTVLFVSHNMGAVEQLCSSAILLRQGELGLKGPVREVVNEYVDHGLEARTNHFTNSPRVGTGEARISSFYIVDVSGNQILSAKSGETTTLVFELDNLGLSETDRISLGFSIHQPGGQPILFYYSHFSNVYFSNLPQRARIRCRIPELALSAGQYLIGVRVVKNGDHKTGETVDWPQSYSILSVDTVDFFGTGTPIVTDFGPVLVKGHWDIASSSVQTDEIEVNAFS